MNDESKPEVASSSRASTYTVVGGVALTVILGVAIAVSGANHDKEPPVAQSIGVALEEWGVVHPNEDIPATDEFINYTSYLDILDPDESLRPRKVPHYLPNNMVVKVIHKNNVNHADGFIVCAYTETALNVAASNKERGIMHSYDVETGELVYEDWETC